MHQVQTNGDYEWFDATDKLQQLLQKAMNYVDALYAMKEYQAAEDLDALLEEAISITCAAIGELNAESKDPEDLPYAVVPEEFGVRMPGDRGAYWFHIGIGYKT